MKSLDSEVIVSPAYLELFGCESNLNVTQRDRYNGNFFVNFLTLRFVIFGWMLFATSTSSGVSMFLCVPLNNYTFWDRSNIFFLTNVEGLSSIGFNTVAKYYTNYLIPV